MLEKTQPRALVLKKGRRYKNLRSRGIKLDLELFRKTLPGLGAHKLAPDGGEPSPVLTE